ncbi:MAG: YbaB/EbfC family nucleoid-associated protein [Armatimonadetes bacterium]|nr:YbaB/EbfC family nucleoid-associated protein [Armatimonadota bacterium]
MLNPLEALISKQLARFQEGLAQTMVELGEAVIEGTAAEGRIVVRVSGLGQVLGMEIAPELATAENTEELAALVVEAINDALAQARELKRQKLAANTPLGAMGVDIPDIL